MPLLKQIEVVKAGALAYDSRAALPKRRRNGRVTQRRSAHAPEPKTLTAMATSAVKQDLHPLLRRDPAAAMARILERVERLDLPAASADADVSPLVKRCTRDHWGRSQGAV